MKTTPNNTTLLVDYSTYSQEELVQIILSKDALIAEKDNFLVERNNELAAAKEDYKSLEQESEEEISRLKKIVNEKKNVEAIPFVTVDEVEYEISIENPIVKLNGTFQSVNRKVLAEKYPEVCADLIKKGSHIFEKK